MAGTFNPFIDPATQAQIDRQYKFADLLQQQALTPAQGQMVGDRYVAPSWTQQLAKLVGAYQAKNIQSKTDSQSQANWTRQLQGMRSAFEGDDPTQTASDSNPTAASAFSPESGQAVDNAVAQGVPQDQAAQSVMQNNENLVSGLRKAKQSQIVPDGMTSDQAFMLSITNPESYKALLEQSLKNRAPTDLMKNSSWEGITPQEQAAGARKELATKGQQNLRPGSTVTTPDANGNPVPVFTAPDGGTQTVWNGGAGSVQTLPGALDAQQKREDITQGAQIHNVVTGSGSSVPMRARDAISQTQNPSAQPDVNTPASFVFKDNNGNTMPPDRIVQTVLAGKDGAQKSQLLQTLAKSSPQDFVDPKSAWATMPKIPVDNSIGQSTYAAETSKGMGESSAKLAEKFGTQADAANQRISLNNQARELLQTSNTGPGAAWTTDLQNIAQKYLPDSINKYFGNSGVPTVALQKDLLNAATQKAKAQFGARITQQEVQLMLSKGSPNVDMPKAAIQYLLDSDNAQANYQIRQAQDFGKYQAQGGDPYQFEGWYSKTFPMTDAVSQIKLQPELKTGNTQPIAPVQTKIIGGKTYVHDGKGWKPQ